MRLSKIYFLVLAFAMFFFFSSLNAEAQCSICTRTAQQLGEKPARGLNAGILYLAFTPLILIGFIGYRFYQRNKDKE
jgi:hypothetical protein